jgi:hypothetical protein
MDRVQYCKGGEEMKKYYYHVVYSFKTRKGKIGEGKVNLTVDNKINTFGRVDDIQEYIRGRDDFESVFLINWIEMEGE